MTSRYYSIRLNHSARQESCDSLEFKAAWQSVHLSSSKRTVLQNLGMISEDFFHEFVNSLCHIHFNKITISFCLP
jgi:hypothetical protein